MDGAAQEDRIAALEARVQAMEDQLALCRLISTWGPAADIGNGPAAASIWADDAVLVTENGQLEGAAAIGEMIDGDGQGQLVAQGCAHVHSFPLVHIDGDRARAVNYGRVYLHNDGGYELWRVSANSWEFRRTGDGWRVARRQVHVIDGGPEARELLGRAVNGEGKAG
jgi:ketosteroid isomerase-like protein